MTDATAFLPGLSLVAGKSLTAAMDAGNLTSNDGLVALREIERRLEEALGVMLVFEAGHCIVRKTHENNVAGRVASVQRIASAPLARRASTRAWGL